MSRINDDSRPQPRSYARARSTSTSDSTIPERRESSATRRWSRDETRARLATAPRFRFPPPSQALLDELCEGYTAITQDKVRTVGKRDLVATGYRVHGEAYLPLVARRFAEIGTVTNLLGDVRFGPPDGPSVHDVSPSPASVDGPLDRLTYSASSRPPFDPTSARRYDRHPANPVATGFFSDEELGTPGDSPAVRALTR